MVKKPSPATASCSQTPLLDFFPSKFILDLLTSNRTDSIRNGSTVYTETRISEILLF